MQHYMKTWSLIETQLQLVYVANSPSRLKPTGYYCYFSENIFDQSSTGRVSDKKSQTKLTFELNTIILVQSQGLTLSF